MFSITKTFGFSAAHHLYGVAADHKCARVHGHNYTVTVEVSALDLNEIGFVIDYGDLNIFGDWIKHQLDHRDLNDVGLAWNPTAELLARELFEVAHMLLPPTVTPTAITVRESEHTSATWRP